MIIKCENCNTKYLINPVSLGEQGRKVQCAKCGSQWQQEAPPPDPASPKLTPIEEITNLVYDKKTLPSLLKKDRTGPAYFYTACFSVMFLIATSLISYRDTVMHYMPASQGLYNRWGFYAIEGLKFDEVKVELQNNALLVQGKIKNTSAYSRKLPAILLSFLDKKNKLMAETYVPLPNVLLEPKASHILNQKITPFLEGVDSVGLSLRSF